MHAHNAHTHIVLGSLDTAFLFPLFLALLVTDGLMSVSRVRNYMRVVGDSGMEEKWRCVCMCRVKADSSLCRTRLTNKVTLGATFHINTGPLQHCIRLPFDVPLK